MEKCVPANFTRSRQARLLAGAAGREKERTREIIRGRGREREARETRDCAKIGRVGHETSLRFNPSMGYR